MVTAPIKGKTLVVYLTTSEESISVVLLAKRGKKHVPVYFVSRMLQGAELEYPELGKLILALVYAARRLQRYFQATMFKSDGSKAGLMLVSLKGKEYTYAIRFEFETTNNEAEYEHFRRDQNKKADALSKLASMTFSKLAKEVLVEVVQEKSVIQREVTDVIKKEGDNWMLPI
ncbi:reverse transcriptase domain-containing protein [Tanacetum coccineum]